MKDAGIQNKVIIILYANLSKDSYYFFETKEK